jgi:hypothetical protein
VPNTPAGARITGTLLSLNYKNADIGAVTVTQNVLTSLTGSFTVPGGDALVGNEYEIEAWGDATWGSTVQALTFQGGLGAVLLGNPLTFAQGVFPTNQAVRWRCKLSVICLTLGATGTWSSKCEATLSANNTALTITNGGTTTTISGVACEASGTETVDTTAAQGLVLQASWAATTGAPTITKRVAMQRKLGVG